MLSAFWHTTESVYLPIFLIDTVPILVTTSDKCYCFSTLDFLISFPSILSQLPEGYQVTSLLSQNTEWFLLAKRIDKMLQIFNYLQGLSELTYLSILTLILPTLFPKWKPPCIFLATLFQKSLQDFSWFKGIWTSYSLYLGGSSPHLLPG